ncbi:MAG: putative quinol monooxygenase [Patulibacter minatonensis]
MAELHVVALITAKPGSEDLVAGALAGLASATREEEGCLAYDLSRSQADPTVFVTVERWRAQADLDAHLQTAHLAEALAAAGEHLAAPPAIHPLAPVA